MSVDRSIVMRAVLQNNHSEKRLVPILPTTAVVSGVNT